MLQKLSCSPEFKKIVFPVWRDDTRKHYVFLDEIVGQVINWAIRQSPYDVPDNIDIAAKKLTLALRRRFPWDEIDSEEERTLQKALGTYREPIMELAEFTCEELAKLIYDSILDVPEICSWNDPKAGTFQNPSITDGSDPGPDYHIIDLHAMSRNATHALLLESLYDEEYDIETFEIIDRAPA